MYYIFEAVKDPYCWDKILNILYYGLSRIVFVIGCMLIFITIVLGYFNIGKKTLTNPLFRVMGKVSFEAALIFPIIIMIFYGN